MVSRLPDGSPINRIDASERALIATFNKDFDVTDLVGKLKAVICLDSGTSYEATAGISGAFGLIIENVGLIGLEIEGRNLYVTTASFDYYIFDVDFDQQHKKVWDINDAGYLLEMPDMILPGSPTKRYVEVATSNDSDALYFNIRVNNLDDKDGYQPISDTAELDDEDVDSWFNDGTGSPNWSHIVSILEKVILMEYDVQADRLSINTETETVEIDGGMLNLFTDGSPAPRPQPVVPLQMTSRFPGGSPIFIPEDDTERHLLCSFNRAITIDDLNNRLKAVVCNIEGEGVDIDTAVVGTSVLGEKFCHLNGDTIFTLEVEGNNVYVKQNDAGYIFDVDFDQQHKRAFAKSDGTYQLIMPETCSEIDNVKMYPFVRAAVTANELDLDIIVNNSKVVVNDIELSDQAEGTIIGDLSLETLKDVLRELIHLEYDKRVNNVDTYSDENPIVPDGTLNLLTD